MVGLKHCEFEELTYFVYYIIGLIHNRTLWMNTAGARIVCQENMHLVMSLFSLITSIASLWWNVTSNPCSMVLRHSTVCSQLIFWSLRWFQVPSSMLQNHHLLHSLSLSCTLTILGASSAVSLFFFFLLDHWCPSKVSALSANDSSVILTQFTIRYTFHLTD